MGQNNCPSHPDRPAPHACSSCGQTFCTLCVLPNPQGVLCVGCAPQSFMYNPPPKQGSSAALIVVIVLAVLLVPCVIAIIAAIAVPNLISARKHGNEASAIGALRTITTAEMIFREGDKDQNNVLDYGGLQDLGKTQLIDTFLASGTKQGYVFTCEPGADASKTFWAMAVPAVPQTTGDRVFYTNQDGAIFYTHATPGTTPPRPDSTGKLPAGLIPVGR